MTREVGSRGRVRRESLLCHQHVYRAGTKLDVTERDELAKIVRKL